jgi:hypothetical protein
MTAGVRPFVTAGIAIAGASVWLATTHDGARLPSVPPPVRLTSVDSPLPLSPAPDGPCSDPLCTELFGQAAASPTRRGLAAALDAPAAIPMNPVLALIGIFVGNGADAPAGHNGGARF